MRVNAHFDGNGEISPMRLAPFIQQDSAHAGHTGVDDRFPSSALRSLHCARERRSPHVTTATAEHTKYATVVAKRCIYTPYAPDTAVGAEAPRRLHPTVPAGCKSV